MSEQAPSNEMSIQDRLREIAHGVGLTNTFRARELEQIIRELESHSHEPASEQPAGYLHEITEPARDTNRMYGQSSNNPWSHWVKEHADRCTYRCTPLYARPSPPPLTVPEGWRLVPYEPTIPMRVAGERTKAPVSCWFEMLDAAPAYSASTKRSDDHG